MSVAEVFHLPELGPEYSIDEGDRRAYYYLIDGDGFQIFIKSGHALLQEKQISGKLKD